MTNASNSADDSENASTIAELVARGRKAQVNIERWPEHKLREAVTAAAWLIYKDENAQRLSELGTCETGMGSVRDSHERLKKRVLGTLRDLQHAVTTGMVEDDRILGIQRFAKPIGLIAATTPATAPVAAVAVNALMMLATRNAVIFCPNPRAKATARSTVKVLRHALSMVDAPPDLFQCVVEPTREQAVELMSAADLVVASGGERTVRRARMTGTPAYGAGVGNAVVIVDETANLQYASKLIVDGKAFDNGTSCSSESTIVVCRSIWKSLQSELEQHGAFLCDENEGNKVRAVAWPDGQAISKDVVGQNAHTIAELAGIDVPPGTRALMVLGQGIPGRDVVASEKLCPILGVWQYDSFDNAIELVNQITNFSGRGHSCGIYSQSPHNVERAARETKVSRVMVNQSTGLGNTGNFDNGMPFTVTLSCGTWGGGLVTDNINWRHFLNYTWVSKPIENRPPSVDMLFADHWKRFGR